MIRCFRMWIRWPKNSLTYRNSKVNGLSIQQFISSDIYSTLICHYKQIFLLFWNCLIDKNDFVNRPGWLKHFQTEVWFGSENGKSLILLTFRSLIWTYLSITFSIQSTRKFPPAIFIDSEFVGAVIEFETGTLEENTFLKSNRFCLTVFSPISFNLPVSRMITFSFCLTQRLDVF